MTSIDLLLDAVEDSAYPESINLGGTGVWSVPDCNRWSFPTLLEFSSRNMTAHKLRKIERSDNRVRELASRLSLEEQVCAMVDMFFVFYRSASNIGLDRPCCLPCFSRKRKKGGFRKRLVDTSSTWETWET